MIFLLLFQIQVVPVRRSTTQQQRLQASDPSTHQWSSPSPRPRTTLATAWLPSNRTPQQPSPRFPTPSITMTTPRRGIPPLGGSTWSPSTRGTWLPSNTDPSNPTTRLPRQPTVGFENIILLVYET